jgi:hypothetical protein
MWITLVLGLWARGVITLFSCNDSECVLSIGSLRFETLIDRLLRSQVWIPEDLLVPFPILSITIIPSTTPRDGKKFMVTLVS